MRIAVPSDPLVQSIVANVQETCNRLGWTLIIRSSDECADMLMSNRADVALITPFHYGMATGKLDLNIVGGPCVALHDFTNTMGVYFPNNVAFIKTIAATHPDHFLSKMGAIVLRERFEAEDVSMIQVGNADESSDCVLAFPSEYQRVATLDVSEEFTDMAECPLPVYLWACRVDSVSEQLAGAVAAMADNNVVDQFVEEVVHIHDEHFTREGKVLYRWSGEVEEGLNAVFNLLYFHQVLPVLPEIKLLATD